MTKEPHIHVLNPTKLEGTYWRHSTLKFAAEIKLMIRLEINPAQRKILWL